jgi:hypothetical protein
MLLLKKTCGLYNNQANIVYQCIVNIMLYYDIPSLVHQNKRKTQHLEMNQLVMYNTKLCTSLLKITFCKFLLMITNVQKIKNIGYDTGIVKVPKIRTVALKLN